MHKNRGYYWLTLHDGDDGDDDDDGGDGDSAFSEPLLSFTVALGLLATTS